MAIDERINSSVARVVVDEDDKVRAAANGGDGARAPNVRVD